MLRVALGNRFADFGNWWETHPTCKLAEYFEFRVPNYQVMRKGNWKGYISLLEGNLVGAGLFLHRLDAIHKYIGVRITDRREYIHTWNPADIQLGITPRPWQEAACEAMRQASNGGGIILGGTGAGKTGMAGMFLARMQGDALFIVDDRALARQTQEALADTMRERVGFIGDGLFRPERVSVAVIDTLFSNRKEKEYKRFANQAAWIIDEFHVMLNASTAKCIGRYQPKNVYGLTGTLDLESPHVSFPAYSLTGPLLYSYTYADAQADDMVVPGYAVFLDRPATFDTDVEAPYATNYARYVAEDSYWNALAAELGIQLNRRNYCTAVLARLHTHLDEISRQLGSYSHLTSDGRRSTGERLAIKSQLVNADSDLIVASTGTLTKGIDIRRLSAVVDASQSKKWESTMQRAGRATRKDGQKTHFLYFDFGWTRCSLFNSRPRRNRLRDEGFQTKTIMVNSRNAPTLEAGRILAEVDKWLPTPSPSNSTPPLRRSSLGL